ncbi:sigma-70 family RNA polymerase sigma factor [Danxiaibacter flavus]|uniref:Sigma-70 family RNA polymerase sigma factor n=1 Tax=Danxiaibacter flavus TaxID=3049108 RepID=A0ABV3ZAQ4_9BACT|nr:sigma-70 family RNA polymerase sigma factor [Chitinophagaceae bacterium DXS]
MPYCEVLALLQQGEESALSALMKEFYNDLYNYAYKFAKDDALVKDAIQEVFIDLWQRRHNADKIVSIRFYLLKAIKNTVLKSIEKRKRFLGESDVEPAAFESVFDVEKIIIERQVSEEQAARLRLLLEQLSARQREIIYLTFYQQLTAGEIALLMNINKQSVYNLLHESLQKLRLYWKQQPLNAGANAACALLAMMIAN